MESTFFFFSTDIFQNNDLTSSFKNQTPSSKVVTLSSNGYSKQPSTSTTDNNPISSAPNTSSSNSNKTPSPHIDTDSLHSFHQSRAMTSKTSFQKSAQEILGEVTVPEILEVFTDLDIFIEQELDEINCQKRIDKHVNDDIDFHTLLDVFTRLKDEYLQDKKKHQQEFEKQITQHDLLKNEVKFETIQEENEEASLNLLITSRMSRLRDKKIEKLEKEVQKQEYLLSKINRVLDRVNTINENNISATVNIERHYLVAGNRLQSALAEIRRLEDPSETLHPRPFHIKGKCVVKEIILEVKPSYFIRNRQSYNEFFVVMLKHDDEIYASKAVCINSDVRTIKFPHTFSVSDAYMDFEMRLEVYGTTFWRQRNSIRATMLKKYGFFQFTLADTGNKRMRFEMVEVIKSENNPLRKKILMKIHQKITPDVHLEGVLMVKLENSWHEVKAMLCGHLLEIRLPEAESMPMLLDLHNYDSDFVIPLGLNISMKPFAFLLRFNHYVDVNDF